ncbi:FAD-dependent pyridine nucleotide-disulfide oxidoreductase [Caldicellulosiruptor saccharolyticus DSM 8903]|uniref:FAD-dependent pyridine nucleotide-disulfide oxidoreductase n=1 Tax=Caldicellulosiruptor saccharolyticus (strain ATCC 43494 / DSM 8903 / Tp8T 6331) TaxID=351627 RepID=A4XKY3_CALS8|nr:FAD-dependent oxidoreductase [Caldicellulosiruptor saccharolyticus]ABP67568.1 FAD-dependent pyridine nucleotide-disulfide oxidoreductase [Caldicellulosiruptor saccharolyticus DSM 8903]
MEKFDVVIIGGGVSALTVTEEIRKKDFNLSMCILSDEKVLPYYRLKLPYYIYNPIDEKFFIKPQNWFEDNNIKIYLNSPVIEVDFDNKIVFGSDKKIGYKKLVIASGAKPYNGDDVVDIRARDKVFSLRTYEDLLRLKEIIPRVPEVAIIGAGLLGLELASTLEGKSVFLIEIAERLLPKQLDEVGALLFEEEIKRKGINIIFDSKVEKIEKINNKLVIFLSNNKEILSDIVIFSAGVVPNTDFVNDKRILSSRKGIGVNTRMQTSIEDVFACGDVAYLDNQNPGTWTFAVESGKVVGKNILGQNIEYQRKPIPYFLKAFGMEIVSAGNIIDVKDSNLFECLNKEKMVYKKFVVKNKRLIGYLLINDTKTHSQINKLVGQEVDPKWIEKYLEIK